MQNLEQLQSDILDAQHILVFTGAGVSAESGAPGNCSNSWTGPQVTVVTQNVDDLHEHA